MSNADDIAKADYLAAERETVCARNARDHAFDAITAATSVYRTINNAFYEAENTERELKTRYRAAQDVANTRVEDVIKMTRTAFERLKRDYLLAYVLPDGATTIYYDPRNGTMAYGMPDGPKPFGYFHDQFEPTFATEAEMLAQFVVDMATL